MVTVCDLLKEEKKIIKERSELRNAVSEEKRLRSLDEASIWLTTDFKALGLTNDKMRNAFVLQEMSKFPNQYLTKKNRLTELDDKLAYIRDCIDTMRCFNIEEFDDKDEKPSS